VFRSFFFKTLIVNALVFQLAFASLAQSIPDSTGNTVPGSTVPVQEIPNTEQDLSVSEVVQQVAEEIEGKRSESALDTFDLLPQKVFSEINPNKVDSSALTLLNDRWQTVSDRRSGLVFNGSTQKLILAFQDYRINELEIPVRSAAFFGKYLVFIKENTNDLSFYRFRLFQASLGAYGLGRFSCAH